MIRVLALDAALQAFGTATVQDGAVVGVGSMSFKRFAKEERHEAVMRWIRPTLDEQPEGTVVAIEQPWLGKSPQTTIKLARLQGALIEAAAARGFEVVLVSPGEWQTSAGIPRRTQREDVKRISRKMAGLRSQTDEAFRTEDVCDAINMGWHLAGVLRMKRRAA